MSPKPKKLFISYRSLDSAKVDKLVAHLRAITDADGNPVYDVWQDKTHIVSGQNWWDQIVDGIIGCEIFLFMVSEASVQSPTCAAELSYARKRNRPIVPIVLEGEFRYNKNAGGNDLTYKELIPQELNDMQAQLLFYEGAGWLRKLEAAIAAFEAAPHRWMDMWAEKPQDPRSANEATNNPATLYAQACEAAEKLDFNRAEALFLRLVNGDSRFQQYAREWVELLRAYDHLLRLEADKYLAFELPDEWELYRRQFPKKFIALFDPKDFSSRYGDDVRQAATHQPKVQSATAPVKPAPATLPPKPTRPSSSDLLPAPFAWVNIPKKRSWISLKSKGGYKIAKYPVTNAQYAKFVDAGGYRESKWWMAGGWWARESENWTEPRYWRDNKWNGAEQPVVGVSWYEAVAFCLWLSDATGERIMLPTEDQWQYAAQADYGYEYPWGNKWYAHRSNSYESGIGKTTRVRQYEGKGDSPFGVVNMAGNVWEWCLTDFDDKSNDMNSYAATRVLRGGSWLNVAALLRVADRVGNSPGGEANNVGFRCVCSLSECSED